MHKHTYEAAVKATSKPAPTQQGKAPELAPASSAPVRAGIGTGNNPGTHASMLAQASGGKLARAGDTLLQLQRSYGNRHTQQVVHRAEQEKGPHAAPPNRTGMPDRLKTGIEALSGMDLSDVRVHANSNEPAKVRALAYTQDRDIYLAPGQERHLPHEAWHVVQQRQGRVRPTLKLKAGVSINDDARLEREAEVMGVRMAASGVMHAEGRKKRPASDNDDQGLPQAAGRMRSKPASKSMAQTNALPARTADQPIQRFPIEIAHRGKVLSIDNEEAFYQLLNSDAILTTLQLWQIRSALQYSDSIEADKKLELLHYLKETRGKELIKDIEPDEYHVTAKGLGANPFAGHKIVKSRGQTVADIEIPSDGPGTLAINNVNRPTGAEWHISQIIAGMVRPFKDNIVYIAVNKIINTQYRQAWQEYLQAQEEFGLSEEEAGGLSVELADMKEKAKEIDEGEAMSRIWSSFARKKWKAPMQELENTTLIKLVRRIIKDLGLEEDYFRTEDAEPPRFVFKVKRK